MQAARALDCEADVSEVSEPAEKVWQGSIVGLLVVTALLIWAGLRPFDFFRPNGVTGVADGLRVDRFGLAVSESTFDWTDAEAPAAMTIEIWLTVAAASELDPEERAWFVLMDDTRLTPLGMRQEGTDLLIWDAVTNPAGDRWHNDRRAADVLVAGKRHYVAVTSGTTMPTVYVDGAAVTVAGGFGIPFARAGEPFGGVLVAGSGPPWEVPWSGVVRALVLWQRMLTPDEISMRAAWDGSAGSLVDVHAEGLIAAYRFDTNDGRIRDLSGRSGALLLPDLFKPPQRSLLAPVDLAEWKTAWFAADVLLNIGGFAVFGYLLVMVVPRRRRTLGIVALAALAGVALSFAFEFAQVYMVTRNSSLQDLILNGAGTLAGALLAWRLGLTGESWRKR